MTFAVSNDNLLQPPKASIPLDGDMPNDLQGLYSNMILIFHPPVQIKFQNLSSI